MRTIFWLAAIVLTPSFCAAQLTFFDALRATSDGRLYFVTGLRPMGDVSAAGVRLYVFSNGELRLVPNASDVLKFEVSADGGVIAINRAGGASILNAQGEEWLRFDGGSVRLSANGRYAAVQSRTGVSLVEISTKQVLWTVEGLTLPEGRVVAGNGVVVAVQNQRAAVVQGGELQRLDIELGVADRLLVEESGRSMAVLSDGRVTVKVFSSTVTGPTALSGVRGLVDYGPTALTYFRANEVVRQTLDGRPGERLFSSASGSIFSAAMVGSRLFVVDGGNLVEHENGITQTVAVSYGFVESPGSASPGMTVKWDLPRGTPLIPAFRAVPPYPLANGGYTIELDGQPVPLVAVERYELGAGLQGNRIRFVVPWNLTLREEWTAIPIVLRTPEGIPMAGPNAPVVYVARRKPAFDRELDVLRARQVNGPEIDGSAPASPGMRVQLSMFGLGEASPMPPNDRPPIGDAVLVAALTCYVSNGQVSRQVAPEVVRLSNSEIGRFEVVLSIPALVSRGEYYVGCEVNGEGDSGRLAVRVTP